MLVEVVVVNTYITPQVEHMEMVVLVVVVMVEDQMQ